jgi:hypothetical protein
VEIPDTGFLRPITILEDGTKTEVGLAPFCDELSERMEQRDDANSE